MFLRVVYSAACTSILFLSTRTCLNAFFVLFNYLFIHERHSEREAETQVEGEVGSMQQLDVGLDPRTSGSCPGWKAGPQLLNHSGIPRLFS